MSGVAREWVTRRAERVQATAAAARAAAGSALARSAELAAVAGSGQLGVVGSARGETGEAVALDAVDGAGASVRDALLARLRMVAGAGAGLAESASTLAERQEVAVVLSRLMGALDTLATSFELQAQAAREEAASTVSRAAGASLQSPGVLEARREEVAVAADRLTSALKDVAEQVRLHAEESGLGAIGESVPRTVEALSALLEVVADPESFGKRMGAGLDRLEARVLDAAGGGGLADAVAAYDGWIGESELAQLAARVAALR